MPKDGSGLSLDGQKMPLWLVLELTYRCPLQCPWCNNPLDYESYNELNTEEWKRVLREARALGSVQLGFSGGEPMLRPDLEELVEEADKLGFYTNLITSGVGLNRERLTKLKEVGLKQVQLSLQSSDKKINDDLVGVESFDIKIEVLKMIKEFDFPMVLNVPVSRHNIAQIPDIIKLAEETGVDYIEFANLQYYNWALLNRAEFLPTREQLEEAENTIIEARKHLGNKMTIYFVIPDYYADRPKACMNGWGTIHLTIAPDGTALPCQEARVMTNLEFSSVKDHSLKWIWEESPSFQKYRGDSWMKEPCRTCPEKEKDFGGCRCQALLLTGDAENTDPACAKSPKHHIVTDAIEQAENPHRPRAPLIMRRRGALNLNFQK